MIYYYRYYFYDTADGKNTVTFVNFSCNVLKALILVKKNGWLV